MAVHIRLARAGAKKKPFYRVVVTDHRSPRGGRFLENIGTFDPSKARRPLAYDARASTHWKKNGAQPSDTVERLIKAAAKAAAAARREEVKPRRRSPFGGGPSMPLKELIQRSRSSSSITPIRWS